MDATGVLGTDDVDLAMSACVVASLGAPPSHGHAFHRLADHDVLDREPAPRMDDGVRLAR